MGVERSRRSGGPEATSEGYLQGCLVDAEALLACVVFAVHNPPPPAAGLTFEECPELEERMRDFIEFDAGEPDPWPTANW
jgi:hypothetical protein